MSWKLVAGTTLLALLVIAAVVLWPDVGAVLALGAAVLLAASVIAANRWADRRRREDTEAGTKARGTIPLTGWRNGGL
jgi:drug/metabolite transporter (DMT)-like permease